MNISSRRRSGNRHKKDYTRFTLNLKDRIVDMTANEQIVKFALISAAAVVGLFGIADILTAIAHLIHGFT